MVVSRKEFLFIAITIFVTICAWVIFEVIHARFYANTELPPDTTSILEPINPIFDKTAIELLQ